MSPICHRIFRFIHLPVRVLEQITQTAYPIPHVDNHATDIGRERYKAWQDAWDSNPKQPKQPLVRSGRCGSLEDCADTHPLASKQQMNITNANEAQIEEALADQWSDMQDCYDPLSLAHSKVLCTGSVAQHPSSSIPIDLQEFDDPLSSRIEWCSSY